MQTFHECVYFVSKLCIQSRRTISYNVKRIQGKFESTDSQTFSSSCSYRVTISFVIVSNLVFWIFFSSSCLLRMQNCTHIPNDTLNTFILCDLRDWSIALLHILFFCCKFSPYHEDVLSLELKGLF
uniref:Uncharacterized protein n=1 Tax=Ditylum brightwellii TaxID=49249 RepID=A0A7S4T8P5_9STRA